MPATDPADVVSDLVADADTDELERLRNRAVGLVDKMMVQAERTLEAGTPSDKAQFTKMVLPTMLKALQDKKEGDDLAELRAEMANLMSEVREGLLGGHAVTPAVLPEVPADAAPEAPVTRTAKKAPARRPTRKAATSKAER